MGILRCQHRNGQLGVGRQFATNVCLPNQSRVRLCPTETLDSKTSRQSFLLLYSFQIFYSKGSSSSFVDNFQHPSRSYCQITAQNRKCCSLSNKVSSKSISDFDTHCCYNLGFSWRTTSGADKSAHGYFSVWQPLRSVAAALENRRRNWDVSYGHSNVRKFRHLLLIEWKIPSSNRFQHKCTEIS